MIKSLLLLPLLSAPLAHAKSPAPKLHLSPTDPQTNPDRPDDWCWGILSRIEHLKAYRQAQISGMSAVHVGTEVTYVIQEIDGSSTTTYEERWIVVGFDKASGQAEVTVEKHTTSNFAYTEHRVEAAKILGDLWTFDAKRSETCGDAFVFAHGFERRQQTIAGQAVNVLTRKQLDVGGADYSQTVSGQVPFFIVSETLSVKRQQGLVTKTKKLLQFKT